jgi:LuxR family maltose regulon positive regulatory protein
VATGYSTLAHAPQALGDEHGALEAMDKASQIGYTLSSWYGARMDAEGAGLWLAQGNLEAPSRWVQENQLHVDDELAFDRIADYLAFARLLLAQEQPHQALTLLARVLTRLEASGAMGMALEALVLQALAYQAQGDNARALAALERALVLAQPEGYVRTFVVEGKPMAKLLRQAVARGISTEYARKLLAELGEETETRLPVAGPSPSLIEPLSERELEVLRLLTSNLPIRDIAGELYIAVSTVRSHVKNIYSKLGVHSRIEAIARAQELGLL